MKRFSRMFLFFCTVVSSGIVQNLCGATANSKAENLKKESAEKDISATGINRKPLLKIGILSDTHIFDTAESCQWAKKAQKLFCDHKTDAVFHIGDLADVNNFNTYQRYRKIVNEVWGKAPKELFLFAVHDQWYIQNADDAYNIMRKGLEITQERHGLLELKGYPFIYIPQEKDEELFGKMLKETALKYQGKPIFILSHVPPCATTPSSRNWGDTRLRRMLDSYPSAIVLCGHTHTSLRNELCLWQKDFVVYNAGYLQGGRSPCVTILEIYEQKILFRRFDLQDELEIDQAHPWKITLPFNPEIVQKEWKERKKHSLIPYFAKEDIKITPHDEYKFRIEIPPILPLNKTFRHQLSIEEKTGENSWKDFLIEEKAVDFYYGGKNKSPKPYSYYLEKSYFLQGKQYRLNLTPFDVYGNAGKTLTKDFIMTEDPYSGWELCGKFTDPMKELNCVHADGTPVPVCGGYYLLSGRTFWMPTPRKIWKGPKGTLFRLELEISSEQNGSKNIAIMPAPFRTMVYGARKYIPIGNHEHFRYIMYHIAKTDDQEMSLMLDFVDTGKIRIDSVKVFRYYKKLE